MPGAPGGSTGPREGDPLEEAARRLLAPGRLTRALLARELRRARRLGLYWRILDPLERALLAAAAKAPINSYKPSSPTARRLAEIIAKLELHTMRGAVLLAGLRRALQLNPRPLAGGLRALLSWAREKLDYILYLGRNLLVVHLYFEPLAGAMA